MDERDGNKQSMHTQSYASEVTGEQMNGASSHVNDQLQSSHVAITEDEEMELEATLAEENAPTRIESQHSLDHGASIPTTTTHATTVSDHRAPETHTTPSNQDVSYQSVTTTSTSGRL
jgi:hypothetical protein